MSEEEEAFRKQLRKLRCLATSLGFLRQGDEIMFSRWPETQAWAIVEGHGYRLASLMVINEALVSGGLEIEDWKHHPDTGLPATEEEIVQYLCKVQERHLKQKFDPLEIYSQVIMPMIKSELENMECYMVEQRYQLPRWERPQWLQKMEGKL